MHVHMNNKQLYGQEQKLKFDYINLLFMAFYIYKLKQLQFIFMSRNLV
jgi:hypothetical protein